MSKVLISFLGTGALNRDNTSARTYKTACYHFDNGEEYNSTFVADALYQHFNIDKVILLGTVKSMWEEVYETFCNIRGINVNPDVSEELMIVCNEAKYNSPLFIPHKDKLESALGNNSHIELIRYGLNHSEINENERIILSLEQYFDKGDELIVDITHSFRSLPLFLMNLILYLMNVSNKHITISHICYGMLDVIGELGYAPIVELNSIIEINNWITGAYAFSQFGNGYQIADLIKKENPSAAKILTDFSDEMNLNHLDGVKNQAQKLSIIKNNDYSPIPSCIIPPTINSFITSFPADTKKSVFLLRIASWHYEHKNYSSSFISLLESILSHTCDSLKLPSDNADDMEIAKVVLGKSGKINGLSDSDINNMRRKIPHYSELSECYHDINQIRNALAHQKEIRFSRVYSNKPIDSSGMIKLLGEKLKIMKPIVR